MSDCRKFYLICFRYVDFFSLYYFQVKTLESKVKNTIYFLVQYMLQCNGRDGENKCEIPYLLCRIMCLVCKFSNFATDTSCELQIFIFLQNFQKCYFQGLVD